MAGVLDDAKGADGAPAPYGKELERALWRNIFGVLDLLRDGPPPNHMCAECGARGGHSRALAASAEETTLEYWCSECWTIFSGPGGAVRRPQKVTKCFVCRADLVGRRARGALLKTSSATAVQMFICADPCSGLIGPVFRFAVRHRRRTAEGLPVLQGAGAPAPPVARPAPK